MEKNKLYGERIVAEFGYGNYSEAKRLACTILRNEPNNEDISCVRDFVERHKRTNGRYEPLPLLTLLQYINYNAKKLSAPKKYTIFIRCLEKDFYNANIDSGIREINISDIVSVIDKIEQLENEDLSDLLSTLNKVKKKFTIYINERRRLEDQARLRQIEEEEKKARDRTITIAVFVVCFFICLVVFCIKFCK